MQLFGLVAIFDVVYGFTIGLRIARNEGLLLDALSFHGVWGIIAAIAGAWTEVGSTMQVYFVLGVVSAELLLAGMRNARAAARRSAISKLT